MLYLLQTQSYYNDNRSTYVKLITYNQTIHKVYHLTHDDVFRLHMIYAASSAKTFCFSILYKIKKKKN